MSPWEVLAWIAALIISAAASCGGVLMVVWTLGAVRELRENYARLYAKAAAGKARHLAEAERSELERADYLQQRIDLPFGQRTTLGEQLEARLDQAAGVIMAVQNDQRALAQELKRVRAAGIATHHAPAVTHTDAPLSNGGAS